jgi:multimeric flavodoxin WrbA
MPKNTRKSKAEPLSAKDIKRIFFERDVTIASLAREWDVPAWNIKAVIYRYPGYILQDIRERLAGFIGCDVAQIGREASHEESAQPAEAAA